MTSSNTASAQPQQPTRRRLYEHVSDALDEMAARVVSNAATESERTTLVHDMQLWRSTAHHRLIVSLHVEPGRARNRRPRQQLKHGSLLVRVDVNTVQGPMHLISVRARHLVDQHGHRIDTVQTLRDLVDQLAGVDDDELQRMIDDDNIDT